MYENCSQFTSIYVKLCQFTSTSIDVNTSVYVNLRQLHYYVNSLQFISIYINLRHFDGELRQNS